MPEYPDTTRPPDDDEEIEILDDADVTADPDNPGIPIEEAFADPTPPDNPIPIINIPLATSSNTPLNNHKEPTGQRDRVFKLLQQQLSIICSATNGEKISEKVKKLPTQNILTCFLDGMEIPVIKAVEIAQNRRMLTGNQVGTLYAFIEAALDNFPDAATGKKKKTTSAEIEESLRSTAKYTDSGSHPEAMTRMNRRMEDPFALTANVCLFENGHKERERIPLSELIRIYEAAGLISSTDAVTLTEALIAKLDRLKLTPENFTRKFESSRKNIPVNSYIQKRLREIEEAIGSPKDTTVYLLSEATGNYEEVSIGNALKNLFEELDLLPEDEVTLRDPLEKKYDGKLETLGLTREKINASVPTRPAYFDKEKQPKLSVFESLRLDIEDANKDSRATFTTYIEMTGEMIEVPILVAITVAAKRGDITPMLARSLSRKCEITMSIALNRPKPKITAATIKDHADWAKRISEQQVIDRLSLWKANPGLRYQQAESEDAEAKTFVRELRCTTILSSLQKTAKSPFTIVAATAAAALLILHVAVESYKKPEKEGRKEIYETYLNGKTIVKNESGSIIVVYPPGWDKEEDQRQEQENAQQVTMTVPPLPDVAVFVPEDIFPPAYAQTSTPLTEDAYSTVAFPDAIASMDVPATTFPQEPPQIVDKPLPPKPAVALSPAEEKAISENIQAILKELANKTRALETTITSWTQVKIAEASAILKEIKEQIAKWSLRTQASPRSVQGELERRGRRYELATVIPRSPDYTIEERRSERGPATAAPRSTDYTADQRRGKRELATVAPRSADYTTEQRPPKGLEESAVSQTKKAVLAIKTLGQWVASKIDSVELTIETLRREIDTRAKAEAARAEAEKATAVAKAQAQAEAAKTTAATIAQAETITAKAQTEEEAEATAQAQAEAQAAAARAKAEAETAATKAQAEAAAKAQAEAEVAAKAQQQPAPQPPSPEKAETPETIEVQIPIVTAKTATGFTIDSAKSYALWKANGWQGAFTRTDSGASFMIIIPDKKTGKSYKAMIPATYDSAQKAVSLTASLIKTRVGK